MVKKHTHKKNNIATVNFILNKCNCFTLSENLVFFMLHGKIIVANLIFNRSFGPEENEREGGLCGTVVLASPVIGS